MDREGITVEYTRVETLLKEAVSEDEPLTIVKAPPGSGKTFLLLRGVEHAIGSDLRVAIGAQTNSQADDICRRVNTEYPSLSITRFAAFGSSPRDWARTCHGQATRSPCPQGHASLSPP